MNLARVRIPCQVLLLLCETCDQEIEVPSHETTRALPSRIPIEDLYEHFVCGDCWESWTREFIAIAMNSGRRQYGLPLVGRFPEREEEAA